MTCVLYTKAVGGCALPFALAGLSCYGFTTTLGRRGTTDALQGPSRRQALTILHTSICDKAGHCDFTGRMLTSPVRPGPETSRPGPCRALDGTLDVRLLRVSDSTICIGVARAGGEGAGLYTPEPPNSAAAAEFFVLAEYQPEKNLA